MTYKTCSSRRPQRLATARAAATRAPPWRGRRDAGAGSLGPGAARTAAAGRHIDPVGAAPAPAARAADPAPPSTATPSRPSLLCYQFSDSMGDSFIKSSTGGARGVAAEASARLPTPHSTPGRPLGTPARPSAAPPPPSAPVAGPDRRDMIQHTQMLSTPRSRTLYECGRRLPLISS
ncbi:hypothetical protein EVAR_8976_1 [Eumeta japonica]|uniref:Uncharacterized protein n=1 Tax=Eumeta variegata TaxID=151549 RepID=A0A4C1WSA1_EUMVA|nr:hypothetical protein EVAR_8976_1 [Eumeta japonica]